MLDWLNGLDRAIFFFVNVQLANPVTDWSMPIVTSDTFLRTLYALAIVLILWKGNRQLRWAVIFSGLALVLTDQVVSHLLKVWIERPRPCQALTGIHLLVNCGPAFSMPSSHAANAFGQAALFSYQRRAVTLYLMIFAAIVALSRVFVGVHYPFDILVGALIGLLVGLFMSWLATILLERLRRIPLQP